MLLLLLLIIPLLGIFTISAVISSNLSDLKIKKFLKKKLVFYKNKVFLFLVTKSKINETYIIPSKGNLYIIFIWLSSVLILPFFLLNIIILIDIDTDINLNNLIILIFFSLSQTYICTLAGLNFLLGNNYNTWKVLFNIWVGLEKNKWSYLFQIFLFILLVVICASVLINSSIYFLDLNSCNFITYLWLRLSLAPYLIYILNIITTIYLKIFRLNKPELDLSIFSPNMFKAITFNRLLVMSISISLFFYFKLIVISKIILDFSFDIDFWVGILLAIFNRIIMLSIDLFDAAKPWSVAHAEGPDSLEGEEPDSLEGEEPASLEGEDTNSLEEVKRLRRERRAKQMRERRARLRELYNETPARKEKLAQKRAVREEKERIKWSKAKSKEIEAWYRNTNTLSPIILPASLAPERVNYIRTIPTSSTPNGISPIILPASLAPERVNYIRTIPTSSTQNATSPTNKACLDEYSDNQDGPDGLYDATPLGSPKSK
uniref:hypothetical protein n=1 Tax=Ciborinia camelliae TaxID=647257 RepID=UPI001FA72B18|nr:hypothetical protein MRV96_mgp35 [Ciborinia camelliae]UNB14724.1 hypothetical protein [Ciborinia camelliae]